MTVNIIDKEKEPLTMNEMFEAWEKLKARYIDAIVMVRRENEYYTFEEDAKAVNGIMKAERETNWKGKRLCILPFYQTDILLSKLVEAGFRIAICEPQFFSPYQ